MSSERTNVPQEIKDWINKHYPRPKVDPEWVQDCYAWVLENNHVSQPPNYTVVIEAMESQLLKSDLYDSTMHGTGLPPQVASLETTTRLTGPPITLQITAITDVGISAFQLEQVRKAREERMRASGGVGGDEDEEGEGGDLEIEGDEGPMPKYPRGTLMLHLSDGVAIVKAMEYKPLPQLSLVGTPLGYKVQIKDVRVVRGVAHLEPRNITLKGGSTDDNNLKWHKLEQSLRQRLGLPQQPEPVRVNGEQAGQPTSTFAPTVSAIHSPLRDVPAPPVPPSARWADDDIGAVEDHRQHVPSTSSTLLPSTSRTPVARPTVSPYFDNNPQGNALKMDVDMIGMDLSPTLRQAAPTLPEPLSPSGSSDFSSFGYDEFDEDTWATLDLTLEAHAPPIQSAPAPAIPVIPPPALSRTNAPPASFSSKLTDIVEVKDDDNDDNDADVFPIRITTPSVFPSILKKAPVIGEKLQLTPAAEKAIQDIIKVKLESGILLDHSASTSTNASTSSAAAASRSPSKAKAARPKTPPQRTTRSNAKLDSKLASPKIPSASPSKRPPPSSQHDPSQSQHFSIPEDAEIITISDSDDADLELTRRTISEIGAADIEMDEEEEIPVPTRHVRRRTGGLDYGTQGTSASQALGRKRSRDPSAPPSATQHGTRRKVAIEPDDVIEISD